jgi:hypothetical protein
MEFLSELWLPILLSAVAVFLASSVIHMALPIHKGDYKGLPREAEVAAAMRELGVTPGEYMIPHANSMKACGSPEMQAKYQQGPVGFLTILPNGMPSMGAALGQWFVYTLVVSVFAAYLAWTALGPGADYLAAFRFTGTVAVLAYATSNVSNSIWKGSSWGITLKFVFDGVVYGLVTAGVFGWLWPGA